MLPDLPTLTGDDRKDIEELYLYLRRLEIQFANAVGFAVDGSGMGLKGGGALDITTVPSAITYTPGSSLNFDGVIFGHVDISFTLPTRAVGVIIRYREQGVSNFKVSYAPSSPYRLINLKVGEIYELQIAGESSNGTAGPFSALATVTIPTIGATIKAPANALYWIGALDSVLTSEIIPSGESGVISVVPTTGVIGVVDGGITSVKRSALTDATASITLTGTNVADETLVQDIVVTHNQNKVMHVTPSLESIANETTTARFTGVFTIANALNSFTVRVVGHFAVSTVNITATLHSRYW